MISVQKFDVLNYAKLKNQIPDKSQSDQSVSFKAGFERLEKNGIFTTGGMSVWSDKTQRMITRSLSKEKLAELMERLEKTENERILICNILRCGIFKRRLAARFSCSYFLKDFTEFYKQKPFESKWTFLDKMLKQFDEYKNQLIKGGVKI